MPDITRLPLPLRIVLLVTGAAAISGVVYLAGVYLVPLTDPIDKQLTAAFNPDAYLPGVDQIFRAITDYTTFLIAVPLISWLVAAGLLRLLPRLRPALAAILGVETLVVFAVAVFTDKLWPNSTYTGVNVLFYLGILAAFGSTAYYFHSLRLDQVRRVTRLFGLVLVSALLFNLPATNTIKSEIARPRPMNDAHKPWNESLRTIPDELVRGASSFPSGHTSSSFALLTPIFWFVSDRRARAGLAAWAIMQGLSRVYTVAHFPFCCAMGGLLGFTIGTLVFFLLGGPALRDQARSATA